MLFSVTLKLANYLVAYIYIIISIYLFLILLETMCGNHGNVPLRFLTAGSITDGQSSCCAWKTITVSAKAMLSTSHYQPKTEHRQQILRQAYC